MTRRNNMGEAFGLRCRVSGKHRFGSPTAAVAPATTESAASLKPGGALHDASAAGMSGTRSALAPSAPWRLRRFYLDDITINLALLRSLPPRTARLSITIALLAELFASGFHSRPSSTLNPL